MGKQNGIMKLQDTYIMDRALRISIACEILHIQAYRQRRKARSLLLALLIGCFQLLYDLGGTRSAVDNSLGYLCDRGINSIIVTSLAFCLVYFVPLKIACLRIRKLARNDSFRNTSLELYINASSIAVKGEHGSRCISIQEIDEVVFGRFGCYFLSGREVVLCCPLAVVDPNFLSSLLTDSVRFSEWRGKNMTNWPRIS